MFQHTYSVQWCREGEREICIRVRTILQTSDRNSSDWR